MKMSLHGHPVAISFAGLKYGYDQKRFLGGASELYQSEETLAQLSIMPAEDIYLSITSPDGEELKYLIADIEFKVFVSEFTEKGLVTPKSKLVIE